MRKRPAPDPFPGFLISALLLFVLGPGLTRAEGSDWAFLPGGSLFAPLLAGPREPVIGAAAYLDEKGYEGALGGAVDFFRWRPAPGQEWGLGLSEGLWILADDPGLSRLQADDWYTSPYLSYRTGVWSFRLEFQDQKSNLGDALEGVRPVFAYTRDNFNLAASFHPSPPTRLYFGGGTRTWWDDFDLKESNLFGFAGFEARSQPFSLLGAACRAYGACHFEYQDLAGGTFDTSLQCGLFIPGAGGPSCRLALTYYAGHSEFGEFYQQLDRHLGLGVLLDP